MASNRTGDFSFVHAADLHLDTPFKGISSTAPEIGAALREASLEAFDSLVEACLERRVAFLVIAGDVYDGAERGLRAQLRFKEGLARLSDAGIRTFVAHGNHDPVEEGWSAISTWPELVHVFGHERVEAVPVARDGTVLATVQGISYGRRDVTENLALGFSSRAGEGLEVGVLHCNVAGAADGYEAYSPCTLAELTSIGLDYWALGHVHSRMVLSAGDASGGSWVVYPGNLQARSPKPSELGPKGATLVTVRGGRVDSLEALSCDRIRFAELEIDVAGCAGLADVHAALSDRAVELLEENAGRSLVVRARLAGRGEAHRDLARSGTEELLEALRADSATAVPFVWWDRIRDESLPALELETLRREDDFAADLVEIADQLKGADDGGLSTPDLVELLGKMPKELERLAREVVADELGGGALVDAALFAALDRLAVAP